ncbi:MAG: sugar transferase [Candidatus Binatus sp.]|uniref:sugar transferase n=1 Tax=Candidatus Binatus sp. TaxID=2811406 RepID=UPI00271D6B40|nr:sugar transferase [Candidatus Binatus sp.]MDO8432689.1 sugar transferase [Candidatus Binatus sp.]
MFEIELRKEKALFAATDALAILAAIVLAGFVNDVRGTPPRFLSPANHLPIILTTLALVSIWFVSGRALGLYEQRPGTWEHFACVFKSALAAIVLVLSIGFVLHGEPPRVLAGMVVGFGFIFILAARGLVSGLLSQFRTHPNFARPIVILGFNSFGRYLCEQLDIYFKQCQVIGFLDLEVKTGSHAGRSVLGGSDEIPALAQKHNNLEVAIVLPDGPAELTEKVVKLCEHNNVRWRLMPALARAFPSGLRVDNVGVIPLIGPRSCNIQGLNFLIKRACDITATAVALVIAAPAMLAAALAILLFDGRPVLFHQSRIGLYGKPFKLLKFRTMRADGSEAPHQDYVRRWIRDSAPAAAHNGDQKVYKLTADPRITRVGRILRRFSLDELPQLINVLRGEMSLIGPRPALSYELELYEDWHRSRLAALPGITGLWQVSGRNSLSFEEMVRLDIKYLEGWSLSEDLRIMMRTIPALFNGGGH